MILYHQTPWKNTLAFRISFDLRNLNIHQTHPALLHFAEHLMFVATKKLNEQALYEKKTFFFDFLGAFTTPLFLCINVTCAQSDLKTVSKVLHEMIYTWNCNPKQFTKEKTEILTELASFESELTAQAVNKLSSKDPEFKTIAIGNKKTLTALKYTDVKKMKKVWQLMLDQAPTSLIVASGNLSPAEKKLLENIVNLKKPQNIILPIPASTQLLSVPGVIALQFKTTRSSLFHLLLERIYFTRHAKTDPICFYEFVHEKNSVTFVAYKKPNQPFNVQSIKKFLLNPPTKAEFTVARSLVTNHLLSLHDGLEPQNLIDWLETYQTLPESTNKNLTEIYNLFSVYSFQTFLKEWKQVNYTVINSKSSVEA